MPCECDILLKNNNSTTVFYSGQIMSGVAIVCNKKPKTIKGIHIIIKGYSKVNWHHGQFKFFEDERLHVGAQIYLHGSENSKPYILPPGVHKYPFQFRLSDNLPSSIKTDYGRINYEILLTVVNQLALNNVFIRSFYVEYPLDLSLDASFQKPIIHTAQCSSWWNICAPQMIKIKFITKTRGFQIGTPLHFLLVVENETKFECKNVQVKLRQAVRHIVDKEDITLRGTIAEKSLGPVAKLNTQKFEDYIDIPLTKCSSLDTCDILQTNYKIRIVVETPRFHEDLITVVPIILGVVPFDGNIIDVVNVMDTHF